ncbi:tumor necrosis factor ligand superfamily member 15 [Esox lucius]|uniref:tumor necrosis factor ligand superfamily member 15 n=1 Tax=Esox lucius TaxID=8010 RepID=UPI001476EC50|nr:tumor necrosis factor ligand superfamily member 15 [Esox lucius]
METCTLNSEDPQDTVIPMDQQTSVIILLKHFQEMKRQENRLRLLMFSLILSFASVFLITHHVIKYSIEKATLKPTEFARQQAKDPEQHLMSQNQSKPSIHLTTPSNCSVPTEFMKWEAHKGSVHQQGFTYNETSRSVVVPEEGKYFVYVGMNFRNHLKESKMIVLKVIKYSLSYKDWVEVLEVKDSIPAENRRTVYTGQVLSLMEGDLLRVWLDNKNYELIDCTTERTMYFGAFLL